MAIKFCPRCDAIMTSKKVDDRYYFVCPKCKFSTDKSHKGITSNEKIKAPEKVGKGVGNDKNPFATFHHKCEKCGYEKAQVIDAGVLYSDEDNLILLKCGKCGHSERIGDKVS